MVQCIKLGKELPGLEKPPYRNELGKKVFENVSAEAWKMWLEHFKMIVNEARLDASDPRALQIMFGECERFFFGEGSEKPKDYVPPKE
jgi:Fe-S cluster biosynthesis and repair protein YggX